MPPFKGALFNLILLLMSATIGAAAITAGAGPLGSLFGSKKQAQKLQELETKAEQELNKAP